MKTNWEDIKLRYITSDVSYKDLAGEFSLSERTIRTRAAKEKWTEEKDKHKSKVSQKIKEGVTDELVETYTKAIRLAKQELIEEIELIVSIRKNIGEEDQYAESRVNKCSATIKDILNTLEHHAYPQREDKADNKTVFVVGQDVKELF